MGNNKYAVCEDCKEARSKGELAVAKNCFRCKGSGIVRDPASYICNKCGGSLFPAAPEMGPYGLVEQRVGGGYESWRPDYLLDLTTYEFSLCEPCLRVLFKQFVVPPSVISDARVVTYEEELELKDHNNWIHAGGPKSKLRDGMCTYDRACTNLAKWQRTQFGEKIKNDVYCDKHKVKTIENCGGASIAKDILDFVEWNPALEQQ